MRHPTNIPSALDSQTDKALTPKGRERQKELSSGTLADENQPPHAKALVLAVVQALAPEKEWQTARVAGVVRLPKQP